MNKFSLNIFDLYFIILNLNKIALVISDIFHLLATQHSFESLTAHKQNKPILTCVQTFLTFLIKKMNSKQTVQEDIVKYVEEACKKIDKSGPISQKFLEVSCVVYNNTRNFNQCFCSVSLGV